MLLEVGGVWVVKGSGVKSCLRVFLVNTSFSRGGAAELGDSLSELQRLRMSFELVLRQTSLMYLQTK